MEKTRKTAFAIGRCVAALVMLLGMSATAKAQITELVNSTTARVHFYLRFTDMAQIRDVSLKYSINGQTYTKDISNMTTILKRQYFTVTIDAPFDQTNKCLLYPIVIGNKGLTWREGMISGRKQSQNEASFYGDAYIFVQQYFPGLTEITRYDYIFIDDELENTVMYEFDRTTGKSYLLPLSEQGICTWEMKNHEIGRKCTQEFRHVGNKDDAFYDMSTYPYRTEVVLALKSAYKSYQYTNPDKGTTYGYTFAESKQFDSGRDDVFHACADEGGDEDIIFKTLRNVDESPWPTGCTSATCSAIIQSYNTNTYDFGGLVGNLRFTFTPKAKKWKAETWVEMTNNHSDGWGTFCSPYDVKVPQGLLVIIIDGLVPGESDRLNMVSMADHPNIPANTGVVVKGTGTFRFLPADPNTIGADRTAYAASGNLMRSVPLARLDDLTQTVVDNINHLPYSCNDDYHYSGSFEGTHYVLTYDTTGEKKVAKFVKATQNTPEGDDFDDDADYGHIPPFKSYLCIDVAPSAVDPVKELVAVFDETDGIQEAAVNINHKSPYGKCYDLTGRRYDNLLQMPHGIYIVNGRKVAF